MLLCIIPPRVTPQTIASSNFFNLINSFKDVNLLSLLVFISKLYILSFLPTIKKSNSELPYVENCGVIGVPHPYKVQVAKAFIVLKPGVSPNIFVKNSDIYHKY